MKRKNEITAVVFILILAVLLGLGIIIGVGALVAWAVTALLGAFGWSVPFWAVWVLSGVGVWLVLAATGNGVNVKMKGK